MNGMKDKLNKMTGRDRQFIRRLLIAFVCALLLVTAGILVFRHVVNERFIKKYRQENYSVSGESWLLSPNVPEGYVTCYNMGNAYYKQGEYETAAAYYLKALEYNPPHDPPSDKECDIRINLALAILGMIDFEDLETKEKQQDAVDLLLTARAVLTEEDCACPEKGEANGHNKDAEQLKKEIDDLLIAHNVEPPEDNEDETEDGDGGDSDQDQKKEGPTQREKDLKEKSENERREALQKQQEAQRDREEQKERERRENGNDPDQGGGSGNDPGGGLPNKNW